MQTIIVAEDENSTRSVFPQTDNSVNQSTTETAHSRKSRSDECDMYTRRLNSEQLHRLYDILDHTFCIHSKSACFPSALEVKPIDIIESIQDKLRRHNIRTLQTCLNGSVAAQVIGGKSVAQNTNNSKPRNNRRGGGISFPSSSYQQLNRTSTLHPNQLQKFQNDIDLVFYIDFDFPNKFCSFCNTTPSKCACYSSNKIFNNCNFDSIFDKLKNIVLECIVDELVLKQTQNNKNKSENSLTIDSKHCLMKNLETVSNAYIQKMFKVPKPDQVQSIGDDCWSLISLRNQIGENIEIKFVYSMKRQFIFSLDSFQILLPCVGLSSKFRAHKSVPGCDCGRPCKEKEKEEEEINGKNNFVVIFSPKTHFFESSCDDNSDENSAFKTNLPVIYCRSLHSNGFDEAFNHLVNHKLYMSDPMSVRGGGFLKYANLISNNYSLLIPSVYKQQLQKLQQMKLKDGCKSSADVDVDVGVGDVAASLIMNNSLNSKRKKEMAQRIFYESDLIKRFCQDFDTFDKKTYAIVQYVRNHFPMENETARHYINILYNIVRRSSFSNFKDHLRQLYDNWDNVSNQNQHSNSFSNSPPLQPSFFSGYSHQQAPEFDLHMSNNNELSADTAYSVMSAADTNNTIPSQCNYQAYDFNSIGSTANNGNGDVYTQNNFEYYPNCFYYDSNINYVSNNHSDFTDIGKGATYHYDQIQNKSEISNNKEGENLIDIIDLCDEKATPSTLKMLKY